MANATKYRITKRLGSRYGRTIKEKLGKAEIAKKSSKTCAFCLKNKVERLAAGIWYCKKCNKKIAGGAYSLKAVRKVVEQED